MERLGVYISVPFCRAKCTFCNFASDAFGAGRMEAYTARVCAEIGGVRARAEEADASVPESVDSVYLGGGTPSLLEPGQMRGIFEALRAGFRVDREAEVTLECAPGQLGAATLDELLRQGMNRVSLGVQSFVDAEAAAVGRLHTRAVCLEEVRRLCAAGVRDINVDLIVGLPGQTEASWRYSVEEAMATGATHASVYMLEVDGESRLGREALAGGSRYGAGRLPDDEAVAAWYGMACELLGAAGVEQYEISNFARLGFRSRHNVKYWRREPYVGFGLDAHSMLREQRGGGGAVRWANGDDLDEYMGEAGAFPMLGTRLGAERIGLAAGFEEALFLGLRLNEGVSLAELREEFGETLVREAMPAIEELREAGLLRVAGEGVCLTARGRLVSNEVFERLLVAAV